MKRLSKFVAFSALSALLFTGASFAQGHGNDNHGQSGDNQGQSHGNQGQSRGNQGQSRGNQGQYRDNQHGGNQRHDNGEHRGWNNQEHDHYIRHNDWRRGNRLPPDYWEHARRVDDWRAYQLRRPYRGYEWREVDGNYVMAAVATGIIASVIVASAAH